MKRRWAIIALSHQVEDCSSEIMSRACCPREGRECHKLALRREGPCMSSQYSEKVSSSVQLDMLSVLCCAGGHVNMQFFYRATRQDQQSFLHTKNKHVWHCMPQWILPSVVPVCGTPGPLPGRRPTSESQLKPQPLTPMAEDKTVNADPTDRPGPPPLQMPRAPVGHGVRAGREMTALPWPGQRLDVCAPSRDAGRLCRLGRPPRPSLAPLRVGLG